MPLSERSAGVIVYRIPATAGGREFLLLDYGRYWDYPKGHVEAGEDDRTAALRELREETGIMTTDLLDGFAHEMTYFFQSRRGLVRKTVIFFLARVAPDTAVTLSAEHVDSAWLTYEAARDRVTYASAKAVLQAAQEHLIRLS